MKPLSILVALSVLVASATALAQDTPTASADTKTCPSRTATNICDGTPVMELIVRGKESKFTVPITSAHWTKLKGPNGFLSFSGDKNPWWLRVERWSPDALDLRPRKHAKGKSFTFHVRAKSPVTHVEYLAVVVFVVTDDPTTPPLLAKVIHESEIKAAEDKHKRAIDTAYDRGHQDGQVQAKAEFKDWAKKQRHHTAASKVLQQNLGILLPQKGALRFQDVDPLRLIPQMATWEGEDYVVRVDALGLDSADSNPYRLAHVRVRDTSGRLVPASLIHPGEPDENGIVARIMKGDVVKIVVAIEQAAGLKLENLRIELSGPNSSRRISMAIPRHTAANLWRPETAEEEERRLWGSQLVISPQVLVGAFWISNGVEGEGRELDATTFTSLGLRMTKGFSENFAVEVDIAG
ncbi:MAG: hypothetical protein MJE77_19560, partial [Proteobacteria bacterium]|nr:hypothetical protein [Pseudomonadota bacterium]